MKKLTLLIIVSFAVFSLISCGPQKQTVKEDNINDVETNIVKVEQTDENKVISPQDSLKILMKQSMAYQKKKQKKYRKMMSYIDQVFEIDPNFKIAKKILLYYRGQGYKELGITDSAKMDFERFSEIEPENKQVLVELDYMYVIENDLESAIEVAEKMIEIDENDKEKKEKDTSLLKKLGKYHYQFAEALKAEDEEDPEIEEHAMAAIESFEEYIESNPEDEEINNLLTYLISKFMDQAALKEKLEANLQSNPDNLKTMQRLARIYYDEGNNDKAADMLVKVIDKEPENIKALKLLIRITKTNVNKAIKYNKMAMKLDDGNEIYNVNLAKLYIEKKRFVDARSECRKALKKNSKNTNIYKTWASIYSESIANCNIDVEYQDKLVFVIAYGLYEKAGDTRRTHLMKESGQVPSKSDFFTNKSIRLPSRKCYDWINKEWNEVKFIEEYLKTL